jgi:glycosyltransferase involved in cell wall biosynthesis
MRRHVRTVASRPPRGWETAGVFGPSDLAPYFSGLPFVPVSRAGILSAGRRADLIHAHGINAGIAALRPGGPPVVLSLHVVLGSSGRTSRSGLAQRAAEFVAARADAVIAVSSAAVVPAIDARVIPPAFDPLPPASRARSDVRAGLGASPDEVVAISVSRLEPEKRLELFVTAVEAAGCIGLIVGDGPERASLTALASGTRTTLLGPRDDVSDLLSAADVFALPSASESYGIAVAEAVDAGLPVVATRTGEVAQIVGDAGIVVEPGDDDAFISALKLLVTDAEERAHRAASTRSRARPDVDSLIAELGVVYDELTAGVVG